LKTTIKLSHLKSMAVYPCKDDPLGGVIFEMSHHDEQSGAVSKEFSYLTADQVGVLIFGMEQAAETAQIAKDREAVTA
jgi:hypothetical protein